MIFSPQCYCSIFRLPTISFGATDVRKDVRDFPDQKEEILMVLRFYPWQELEISGRFFQNA